MNVVDDLREYRDMNSRFLINAQLSQSSVVIERFCCGAQNRFRNVWSEGGLVALWPLQPTCVPSCSVLVWCTAFIER